MPDQVDLLGRCDCVEHGGQVGAQVREPVAGAVGGDAGLTGPSDVVHHAVEVACQPFDDAVPDDVRVRVAVHEQDGRPVAWTFPDREGQSVAGSSHGRRRPYGTSSGAG